jgi:hypothetical protein
MFKNLLERAPLVMIGLVYLSGIIFNHLVHCATVIWFGLLLIGLLVNLLWLGKARSLFLIGMLCFLLGGMNHALRTATGPNHLSRFAFADASDSVTAMVEQVEVKSSGGQKSA